MHDGISIDRVIPGSLAAECDLEPGDVLLAINGQPLRDIIDYEYLSGDDDLLLEVLKSNGEVWEVEIEREEGESLGLTFSAPLPRHCSNACVFCFVDQLPSGLRPSLYVKDEDYRLSFLYGNFVTLTSLTPEDRARIKEQHLSPLYISVHATDPVVRSAMLGHPDGGELMAIMRDFAAAGITMHTQVVLCPGLNDGQILEQTVVDLVALAPRVASLAIVPVGLTEHRCQLPHLNPVSRRYAKDFLAKWLPRSRSLAHVLGAPFLFFADEFFLRCNEPFPPLAAYGEFPQLENGVGMMPQFLDEAGEVLSRAKPLGEFTVSVVTGVSAFPQVDEFLCALGEKTGIRFQVIAPHNTLFGHSVTVTGLTSGRDLLESLQGRDLGVVVAIPDVMLKDDEDVFIDSLTLQEVGGVLNKDMLVFSSTPSGFYAALVEYLGR